MVVMLHIVVGFGYAFYKIEYGGKKKKDDKNQQKDNRYNQEEK